MNLSHRKEADIIKRGGVGLIPTDTIYGISSSAFSLQAVEKIYDIKKRNKNKPFIILINSLRDLKLFNITLDQKTEDFLSKIWPGKVSVLLPCPEEEFFYLHRGTKKLAFRWPSSPELLEFIEKTGPLTSTSANPEGEHPAESVREAKKYFGEQLDFYWGKGKIFVVPSTLIELKKDKITVLRQGEYKIDKEILNLDRPY